MNWFKVVVQPKIGSPSNLSPTAPTRKPLAVLTNTPKVVVELGPLTEDLRM
jgi:hypothetical protein